MYSQFDDFVVICALPLLKSIKCRWQGSKLAPALTAVFPLSALSFLLVFRVGKSISLWICIGRKKLGKYDRCDVCHINSNQWKINFQSANWIFHLGFNGVAYGLCYVMLLPCCHKQYIDPIKVTQLRHLHLKNRIRELFETALVRRHKGSSSLRLFLSTPQARSTLRCSLPCLATGSTCLDCIVAAHCEFLSNYVMHFTCNKLKS